MTTTNKNSLKVRSIAFSAGGHIPVKYSCEGDDINPPLAITGFPEGTKTLAIIVEDPDAPRGTFDHWLVWNIPPNEPIDEKILFLASVAAMASEKQAMEVLAHPQVLTVIFSEYMHWIRNWIYRQVQIKKPCLLR
jgi:phosphatidylethanolamine-binding protein (PEBP) family uncharacterized protein